MGEWGIGIECALVQWGLREAALLAHSRKSHCASWMLLISFLLDMAVGTMIRHLNICHKLGEFNLGAL